MEIKINIPQNDYVQPTEVRQEIVQDICSTIVWWLIDKHHECYDIIVDDSNRYSFEVGLYLRYLQDGHVSILTNDEKNTIRIRGCEMQAVFDAMWSAKYYISGEYNQTQAEHTYHITHKDGKYDHHTKKFTPFID